MDADRISDSKVAQGISESVFENAICIAPLKGNTGSEIVREVQRQIAGIPVERGQDSGSSPYFSET